jgi:multicomponent Na+:H+ antiporter subunit F
MELTPILQTGCWIATLLLVLGMAFAFLRLLRGPSLPDRVVALDVIATMAIGVLALTSITTGQKMLLDVALAIAIITFLGTVALAISIEKGVFK